MDLEGRCIKLEGTVLYSRCMDIGGSIWILRIGVWTSAAGVWTLGVGVWTCSETNNIFLNKHGHVSDLAAQKHDPDRPSSSPERLCLPTPRSGTWNMYVAVGVKAARCNVEN